VSHSLNAVVYEAVQRTYRNAVVAHIRENFRNAFPRDFEERVKKPFDLWEEIVQAADASAAGGLVAHHHKDAFDYLDVSHFVVLFEQHFDLLAPTEGFPPEVTKKLKQQVLGYIREIKIVRDPLSHPPESDLDAFDALRAVDNAVRALRVVGLDPAAEELDPVRHEIAASVPPPDIGDTERVVSISDTLPPRDMIVVDFVGRRKELQSLWEWLADEHSGRWLLCGEGGKGKSAIAYQFAADVLSRRTTDLYGVYWLSAKRRRFAEGAVAEIASPDFWDCESAVDKLLRDFGWSEHLEKPLEAKKLLMLELVKEFPSLVIVDDVDSLDPEAEDAVEFLASTLAAAGARVLLTSRRSVLGMGSSSSIIEGLADGEAQEFIDSRMHLLSLDASRFSSKQRKRIIKLCEGSPLYMEDLLRLCNFLAVSKALETWQGQTGDIVRRYALEREMEMLSPNARAILEACSVTPGAVTALEIQRILGVGEDKALEGLDELRRHYLVPAPELVEDLPRFQVNRNLASLVRSTLDATERLRSLETAIAAVFGKDLTGRSSGVVDDYKRQAEVLRRAGNQEKAEETLRAGLRAHPNSPPLLSALGAIYARWQPKRLADARSAWRRAYELGSGEKKMYLTWANLEQREQEWASMLAVCELGLERLASEDPALLQHAGYAASRLAQSLLASFNSSRAAQEFKRSDELIGRAIRASHARRVDQHFISRTYRAWIVNAQFQDEQRTLCNRLREWLEWDPTDSIALEEVRRQGEKCPEVQALVNS